MKLLRLIYIIGSLLFFFQAPAQNLVTNPDFETQSATLNGEGQINIATGWSAPLGSTGTPDLYSSSFVGPITAPCDAVGVPLNAGGNAPPHSAVSYAGISNDFSNGYYEYITIKLNVTMITNETYFLDMWVLLADSSRYATNKVGAILSSAPISQIGSGIIPITPQFENITVISDATNWKHLTFAPYSALGGEQYLTIGVFRTASNLTILDRGAKNTGCSSFDNSSYIYIDDVTLIPGTVLYIPPVDTSYVCPYSYSTSIYPVASNVAVTWLDQNLTTIPNSNGQITVPDSAQIASGANVPGAVFTYYIIGNNQFDSVKLVVINQPLFDLGPDTTFCEGDSVKLNAYQPNAISYMWSTGEDSLSFIYVTDTGHYSVQVDNPGCGLSDSIYFFQLLPNPPVSLGEDSLFCFYNFDSLRLDATTSDAVNYFWRPTGESTPKIIVKFADFYSVTITRENGCRRTPGFEVFELCPPDFYAPNAFTPDGDGINDIYKITAFNYEGYTLSIYDRFGQQLFKTKDSTFGWDGKFNSKESPIGIYVYKININGFNTDGEKESEYKLGTFILYR